MKVMNHQDPALPEELPRDQEMAMLLQEVAESMDTIASYHKGNTALLEALMNCVEFRPDAIPEAVMLLNQAGLMSDEFVANRAALEQRKAHPLTWEQALCKLVKQPEHRAELLAMGKEAFMGVEGKPA
jgi:hypothetical protein